MSYNNNNPSMRIYVNKIKKKITFKIKTGSKLLMPETMKLVGSTKIKQLTIKIVSFRNY